MTNCTCLPLPCPGLLCGLPGPEHEHVPTQQREGGEYPLAWPSGLPSKTAVLDQGGEEGLCGSAGPRGSAPLSPTKGRGAGSRALRDLGASTAWQGEPAQHPHRLTCFAPPTPGQLPQGVCLHPRPYRPQCPEEGLCSQLQPNSPGEPGPRCSRCGRPGLPSGPERPASLGEGLCLALQRGLWEQQRPGRWEWQTQR